MRVAPALRDAGTQSNEVGVGATPLLLRTEGTYSSPILPVQQMRVTRAGMRCIGNRADPGAPAFDWRLLANGYLDRRLYDRQIVDTHLPFDQLRMLSHINAKAKAADRDPHFHSEYAMGCPTRDLKNRDAAVSHSTPTFGE